MPGLVRSLQHARGGRYPGAGAPQGAGIPVMIEDTTNQSASTVAADAQTGAALPQDEVARLTDQIVSALKTVYDPEIPADIYELGLIYKIAIADDRTVTVDMTLTTPNCPSAQELPIMAENAVASVPGVGPVTVNIVWDPPWGPGRRAD